MATCTKSAAKYRIQQYVDALTFQMPQVQRETLLKIKDLDRRLLALKRYLFRVKEKGWQHLRRHWAWTEQQHEDWKGSAEDHRLTRELRTIRGRFEVAHPGFTLRNGPKFRPLHRQIHKWNTNGSVATNAAAFWKKAVKEICSHQTAAGGASQPAYPELGKYLSPNSRVLWLSVAPAGRLPGLPSPAKPKDPRNEAIDKFRHFLEKRSTFPTKFRVATPGLSDHGQARAIDFRVVNDATRGVVVGAGNKALWHSTGWAQRLKRVVLQSRNFDGPLDHEPWHFDFVP